jgi:hypothetical protein
MKTHPKKSKEVGEALERDVTVVKSTKAYVTVAVSGYGRFYSEAETLRTLLNTKLKKDMNIQPVKSVSTDLVAKVDLAPLDERRSIAVMLLRKHYHHNSFLKHLLRISRRYKLSEKQIDAVMKICREIKSDNEAIERGEV